MPLLEALDCSSAIALLGIVSNVAMEVNKRIFCITYKVFIALSTALFIHKLYN